MHRDISFWVAVGLVAIVSVILFKVLAGKFGDRVPVLADLAGAI